jgi:hypothetical protein
VVNVTVDVNKLRKFDGGVGPPKDEAAERDNAELELSNALVLPELTPRDEEEVGLLNSRVPTLDRGLIENVRPLFAIEEDCELEPRKLSTAELDTLNEAKELALLEVMFVRTANGEEIEVALLLVVLLNARVEVLRGVVTMMGVSFELKDEAGGLATTLPELPTELNPGKMRVVVEKKLATVEVLGIVLVEELDVAGISSTEENVDKKPDIELELTIDIVKLVTGNNDAEFGELDAVTEGKADKLADVLKNVPLEVVGVELFGGDASDEGVSNEKEAVGLGKDPDAVGMMLDDMGGRVELATKFVETSPDVVPLSFGGESTLPDKDGSLDDGSDEEPPMVETIEDISIVIVAV